MSIKKTLVIACLALSQSCGKVTAPVYQRDVVKDPEPTTTVRGAMAWQTKTSKAANSSYYVVKRGDTLYSIAWLYQQDYKSVASWNQISPPYTIYPGQIIRLKPRVTSVAPKQAGGEKKRFWRYGKDATYSEKKRSAIPKISKKVTGKTPLEVATLASKPKSKSATSAFPPAASVKWNWPTVGKIIKPDTPTSKKGIDIVGKRGQTIKAAAAGDVVYSGSGLLRYGKLIIIKHNEIYLSAYAYNNKLLVKEGDRVRLGQPISRMGQDQTGRAMLHFEIRKNGKPINPRSYLPKKPT